MSKIVVTSQKEYDALPDSFDLYTIIELKMDVGALEIRRVPENGHVVARESSHVEAWESSHVEAWESSHVEARGCVSVHLQSDLATVIMFMFAICIAIAKGKISKKSKAATVVTPQFRQGVPGWLDQQGIEEKKKVVLFKRVSKDFKTQENTTNETLWLIGSTVEHSHWRPETGECGAGKFHACSRPYF